MEVILLSDVKGLGKKGESKTTSDGYANNYLIPHKLAIRKTPGSVKVLEKQNKDEELRQEALKKTAIEYKDILDSLTLEFKAKAQANGAMAGTISTKEVEKKLKDDFNVVIDKRKIIDKYPINAFGVTNLKIELYKGVVANIKIHVVEDK